jgi:hypothetical protein
MGRGIINRYATVSERVHKFTTRDYYWEIFNYCQNNPKHVLMLVIEDSDRMHSEYFLFHLWLARNKAKVEEFSADVKQKDASNRRIVFSNGASIRFISRDLAEKTDFYHLSAQAVAVIDYQNYPEDVLFKIIGRTFYSNNAYKPWVMLFFRVFQDTRGEEPSYLQRP